MALILEIRDRRGTTTWHPLHGASVTLGRALSNDIILDDPYVDARHAHIALDENGALTIRDLGTVNGMLAGGGSTNHPIAIQPGVEVKIGRTTLRFRDRDEVVPPAFLESSYAVPRAARWVLTPRGSLLVVVAMMLFNSLVMWFGNTERSGGVFVFGAVIAVAVLVTIWSAIWAVAVRGTDRRFHMRSHLAIASAATVFMLFYSTLNEWLVFFFPDVRLFDIVSFAVLLLIIAAVIAGHLTVAGVLTRRLRWRAGLSVSGVLLLLVIGGAALQDDKFSDVPKFPGQLKPISARLVPTRTVDQFVDAMGDARSKADDAIARSK